MTKLGDFNLRSVWITSQDLPGPHNATHLGLVRQRLRPEEWRLMLPRSPATVVVLERNAAARELIERALREGGDRVLVTNDPIEALELARRVRIDLLVGELDGPEQPFLRQLRAVERSLRILYLDNRDEPGCLVPDGEPTLRVPFSLEELREAVENMLGRGP